MKYELFLFDLDDTLLCFRTAEKHAFEKTLKQYKVESNVEMIFQRYKEVAQSLWDQFERGEVTRDRVRVERYRTILQEFGLNHLNDQELSQQYLENLIHEIEYVPNALGICEHLSPHAEIIVVTNGFSEVAKRRIQNSDFRHHVSHVVSSDCTGFAKPDPRIFHHAFSKANKFNPERTLMIGDSLKSDILGAKNVGIDSVWFNPDNKPKDFDIEPNYTFHDLNQIQAII